MPHTNPNRSEPLLYTLPEAAAAIRISRAKLYELLDSNELESIHIGRSRKVPAEALRIYIDQLWARSRSQAATQTINEGSE